MRRRSNGSGDYLTKDLPQPLLIGLTPEGLLLFGRGRLWGRSIRGITVRSIPWHFLNNFFYNFCLTQGIVHGSASKPALVPDTNWLRKHTI